MKEIIHISHSLYKTDYQTIDIFSDYKFTYHIVYIKLAFIRCKTIIINSIHISHSLYKTKTTCFHVLSS